MGCVETTSLLYTGTEGYGDISPESGLRKLFDTGIIIGFSANKEKTLG